MSTTKQGYLLIADITGYTSYLSQSELEHAQEILQTLLEVLIENTRPPLIISRLAGDAVISYGLQDNFFQGQTFVEIVEDTYAAFRKAIELMVLNNSCQCNACANVSNLDLKFFIHYGSFGIQRLSEHDELVGNDVNLIHRLLKNHVSEVTGFTAYTLYTDAAIRQLKLQEVAQTMAAHEEAYEHLGQVQVWVQDMHPVWKAKKDELKIEIEPSDVLAYAEGEIPLPPTTVWDLVTDPKYRAILLHSVSQEILNRQGGRLAPGSVYHCFHGSNRTTRQTILEWRPFEQMTTEDTTPVPGTTGLIQIKLVPNSTGTHLSFTGSKARGPWLNRLICNLVGRSMLKAQLRNGMADFLATIEMEIAAGKYTFKDSIPLIEEPVPADLNA